MKTIFPLVRPKLRRAVPDTRGLSASVALTAVGLFAVVYTAPPTHAAVVVDSDAYNYIGQAIEPMAAPVEDFDSGSLPASNTLTNVGADASVGTPGITSDFAQAETNLSANLAPGTVDPLTDGFSLDTDADVDAEANGQNNGPGNRYFASSNTGFSLDFTLTDLPGAFTLSGTLDSNGNSAGDLDSTAQATVILTNLGTGDEVVNESSSGVLFGNAVNEAGPLAAGSYRLAYDASASAAKAPGGPPNSALFSAAFEDFDFAVTQPIPEPAPLALLGLGGALLLSGRKRGQRV